MLRHAFLTGYWVLLLAGTGWAADTMSSDVVPLTDLSPAQLRLFLQGVDTDWRASTGQARGVPQPSPRAFPDDAARHPLPAPNTLDQPAVPLLRAIAERRSRRSFGPQPVSLDTLSILLWHTQGTTATVELADGNALALRAAPSAGARYPLETYLFVQSSDALDAGLYQYDVTGHQLIELASDTALRAALQRACFGEPFIYDASVVVVFTAVPIRTEWRYGPIAHRMIAYEAGHAAQNLLLVAEAVGLNACPVAAYHQSSLDRLLGVDGEEEFALYLVALGEPPPDATP